MRAARMVLLVVGLVLSGVATSLAQPSRPSTRAEPAQSHSLPASSPSAPAMSPVATSPSAPAASSGATLPSPPRYSATNLYNLANSYARAGKPGLAVLNYERAALLSPNDPDIVANLDYVRTAAHIAIEPRTRFTRIARVVSPNSAAWLGVLGIALAGAALLAKILPRRFRWVRAAALLLGVAAMTLTLANALLLWPHLHEAVVLTNQTPALVSPVPMADTAFVLPEAETVTMAAKHEDYILVRTHGGLSGWVARANLGTVVP